MLKGCEVLHHWKWSSMGPVVSSVLAVSAPMLILISSVGDSGHWYVHNTSNNNDKLPLSPDVRPPTVQPTYEEPSFPLPEPPLPPDIVLDNATPHWFRKIILLLVAWLNLRYHLLHRAANLLLKISASIFYGLGAFTVDDKPAQTLRTAFNHLALSIIFRSILCVLSA
jgi:hypothetical protein